MLVAYGFYNEAFRCYEHICGLSLHMLVDSYGGKQ